MKPTDDGEGVARHQPPRTFLEPSEPNIERDKVEEIISCDHPDRDMSYSDTNDYSESKIAHCSACGHEWFISQREWRELTGILP